MWGGKRTDTALERFAREGACVLQLAASASVHLADSHCFAHMTACRCALSVRVILRAPLRGRLSFVSLCHGACLCCRLSGAGAADAACAAAHVQARVPRGLGGGAGTLQQCTAGEWHTQLAAVPPSLPRRFSPSHTCLTSCVNTAHAWLSCSMFTMLTMSCCIVVLSHALLSLVLQEIAHSFAGHTVLVVTHGEVGALAVCRVAATVTVSAARYGGSFWQRLTRACPPACVPAAVCRTTVRAPGRFDGRALQRSV